MNAFTFIAAISLLAGWHLDAIDQALIERHRADLEPLNIPSDPPVIIDTDARGRPGIRRDL